MCVCVCVCALCERVTVDKDKEMVELNNQYSLLGYFSFFRHFGTNISKTKRSGRRSGMDTIPTFLAIKKKIGGGYIINRINMEKNSNKKSIIRNKTKLLQVTQIIGSVTF